MMILDGFSFILSVWKDRVLIKIEWNAFFVTMHWGTICDLSVAGLF